MVESESERYWDERARENALYFVDNQLDYENPDVDAFWRGGDEAIERICGSVSFALDREATVVDIGCGVGRLTRALAARTRHVYGVDVSREMLSLAQQYNAHVSNIEWRHVDGHGLSVLDDGVVDGCFSHVVFQHIPDPKITLDYVRDMGRVLRPGGWALFVVSTDPQVHRRPRKRGSRLRSRLRLEREPNDERAWWGSAVDVAELRDAARDGGLDIERLLGAGSQFTTVLARKRQSPTSGDDSPRR